MSVSSNDTDDEMEIVLEEPMEEEKVLFYSNVFRDNDEFTGSVVTPKLREIWDGFMGNINDIEARDFLDFKTLAQGLQRLIETVK